MTEIVSMSWSCGWFSTVERAADGTLHCVAVRMVSAEPFYWGA